MAENFVPSGAFMEQCAECMLSAEQRALLRAGDVDFAWGWEKRRFRGNFYRTHDGLSLALRLLPERIMTPDEIGMPSALRTSLDAHDGLVLLCGATGAGKTTTLAALPSIMCAVLISSHWRIQLSISLRRIVLFSVSASWDTISRHFPMRCAVPCAKIRISFSSERYATARRWRRHFLRQRLVVGTLHAS